MDKYHLIASVYTEEGAHRIILLEPAGSGGEEAPEEGPEPEEAAADGEEDDRV